MANDSLRLSEYPTELVRLSCEKCGRSGQYRKQKLIERYCADMRLPDLREEIAQCRRHGQMHDACMVRYPDAEDDCAVAGHFVDTALTRNEFELRLCATGY